MNENVLLELTEEFTETKTTSGINYSGLCKRKASDGQGCSSWQYRKFGCFAGDVVICKKFSGTEMKFEGKEYLFVPYGDLLAKIVETEAI